ncbi:MAG: MarR family winged helix-turn-helix transcriptional regulator [Clostridium sp.]|uniref:MarR family winged helix-turn-helix transcriptional regulator n=1 Tax=Clostridium sp. TaxID=1506 RepID=UPI003F377CAE
MEDKNNIRYIGKYISMLYRRSLVYLNNNLKEYNITSSEYMYIINIPDNESVNLTYLSHKLSVDPALTTKVINNLVKKGFIEKIKSETDKRACEVSLTKEGQKVKPEIFRVLNDWVLIMTEGMEEDERMEMMSKLEYMVDNTEK